jgi:hypothetical protein
MEKGGSHDPPFFFLALARLSLMALRLTPPLCCHRSRWLSSRVKPKSKKAGRKTGLFLCARDKEKRRAGFSAPFSIEHHNTKREGFCGRRRVA